MRHGAYRHETKYYRHDIGHSLNSTCDIKPFLNRHGNFKNSNRGHSYFLNSTCDIGDPPSRAPAWYRRYNIRFCSVQYGTVTVKYGTAARPAGPHLNMAAFTVQRTAVDRSFSSSQGPVSPPVSPPVPPPVLVVAAAEGPGMRALLSLGFASQNAMSRGQMPLRFATM